MTQRVRRETLLALRRMRGIVQAFTDTSAHSMGFIGETNCIEFPKAMN